MRELTKSVLSFSWIMPLFGLRQMVNLMRPDAWSGGCGAASAAAAFDAVTDAARAELEGWHTAKADAGEEPCDEPVPAEPTPAPGESPRGWGPMPSSTAQG